MTHKVRVKLPTYNTYAVVNEDHPSMDSIKSAGVHRALQPLLAMLSKQRPKWEFIADGTPTGYDPDTKTRQYTMLSVFEGGEQLGNLGLGYTRGNTAHGATNPRIAAPRERSSWAYTKDTKKLTSIILKNFYRKTVEETLNTAAEKMQNAVYSIRRDISAYQDQNKRRIDMQATQFLFDNWDAFTSSLQSPALVEAAYNYRKSIQDAKEAMALDKIVTGQLGRVGTAALLVERGEHFYIREYNRADTTEPTTGRKVALDDLPDAIKGKLALLKLTSVKDFVHGVGVRVLDDTYLVADMEAQP